MANDIFVYIVDVLIKNSLERLSNFFEDILIYPMFLIHLLAFGCYSLPYKKYILLNDNSLDQLFVDLIRFVAVEDITFIFC